MGKLRVIAYISHGGNPGIRHGRGRKCTLKIYPSDRKKHRSQSEDELPQPWCGSTAWGSVLLHTFLHEIPQGFSCIKGTSTGRRLLSYNSWGKRLWVAGRGRPPECHHSILQAGGWHDRWWPELWAGKWLQSHKEWAKLHYEHKHMTLGSLNSMMVDFVYHFGWIHSVNTPSLTRVRIFQHREGLNRAWKQQEIIHFIFLLLSLWRQNHGLLLPQDCASTTGFPESHVFWPGLWGQFWLPWNALLQMAHSDALIRHDCVNQIVLVWSTGEHWLNRFLMQYGNKGLGGNNNCSGIWWLALEGWRAR